MSNEETKNADRYYEEANELFVNDDFKNALEFYSKAIEFCNESEKSKLFNYYIGRSQTYLKLSRAQDALKDAQNAINLNSTDPKAYLKKGMALYHLNEYENALEAFEFGHNLADNTKTAMLNIFIDWINKCKEFVKKPEPEVVKKEEHLPQVSPNDNLTTASSTDNTSTKPQNLIVKHDWYQTESHVVVCALIKNMTKNDVCITTTEDYLKVENNAETNPQHFELKFNLPHKIQPNDTQIKFLTNKIEIKIKKAEGIHWSTLEQSKNENLKVLTTVSNTKIEIVNTPVHYPSSSKKAVDWDKLAAEVKAEEKDEKLEGDAALNKLFQQIYSDGSDEVKRAMNKSFAESGGTVLSTNWKDIGVKKVECKPPDGMEFKKWD